jgi:putative endonuclease
MPRRQDRQRNESEFYMDRMRIGMDAENAACAYLELHGVTVLLRNYRRRNGELDVVARDGDVLAIVEVRTRSSEKFGGAAASVTARKQLRLLRAAQQLMQQRKDFTALKVRFDVIVVHQPSSPTPRIEWIKHAFTA